jgi:hypothetical protein
VCTSEHIEKMFQNPEAVAHQGFGSNHQAAFLPTIHADNSFPSTPSHPRSNKSLGNEITHSKSTWDQQQDPLELAFPVQVEEQMG